MTTAGKVFTVLNVIAAIVYVFAVAHIANHRVTQRKTHDEKVAQNDQLRKDIAAADFKRVELRLALDLARKSVNVADLARKRAIGLLEAEIASATDSRNEQQTRVAILDQSTRDVQSEIEDRLAEGKRLDGEIAELQQEQMQLAERKQMLEGQLAEVQDSLARARAEIQANYGKLLQLEKNVSNRSTTGKVASLTP